MTNFSSSTKNTNEHCVTPAAQSENTQNSVYNVVDIYSEPRLRRIYANILSVIMFVLLLCSSLLNFYEDNTVLSAVLLACSVIPLLSFIWLRDKKHHALPLLFLMVTTLTILAGYLLFVETVTKGSYFWFMLFPPMVVLCMGLKHGSLVFWVFYAFLMISMCSPLNRYIANPMDTSSNIRFFLVLFGAFVFSWCAEYVRQRTYLALKSATVYIEHLSLTDALTGLGNRRDFDRFLPYAIAKTRTSNSAFSLALLDIDHFKKVNDTYGHDVGDLVLKHVADLASHRIRASDRLFRWGGEEFSLIMRETTFEEATICTERIRAAIEKTPFLHGDESIFITISIGFYSSTKSVDTRQALEVADKSLYEAKSGGRNRVIGHDIG